MHPSADGPVPSAAETAASPAAPGRFPAVLAGAVVLLLVLIDPLSGSAQEAPPGQGSRPDRIRPLLVAVDFPGAEHLSDEHLQAAIATRPSRCRGLLLTPFCWFTNSEVLVERRHLNPSDLPYDELRLRVTYFRAGFRETTVISEVLGDAEEARTLFHVEEGPPTLVRELEVRQLDTILSPRDLRRANLPSEGDPLSLARLEEAIEALAGKLAEEGYLDAEVRDSISIGPGPHEARLEIVVDPGPRSTVREIEVVGNVAVDDAVILAALPFGDGDVLTTPDLREGRNGLHASSLFHEADVTVPEQPDSAKVVLVRVREAPPRLSRIGGGVNTLEFAQAEARFSHYNWRGDGGRLDLRGTLGNLFAGRLNGRAVFRDVLPGGLSALARDPFLRPTWQISADFTQPHFRGAENVLGAALFAHRQMIPGISVDEGRGSEISATRRMAHGARLSLTYRFEVTSVEADDVFLCVSFGLCEPTAIEIIRGRNRLSPLGLSFNVERSDDPLAPSTGHRLRLDLEHASGPTASDFRYHRFSGEGSYYVPFGALRNHVLAARIRFGWVDPLEGTAEALGMAAEAEALLHPRKRFFSGGARSVRGYPESQLGPRILTIPRDELLEEGRCLPEEIADGSCDPALAPVGAFSPRAVGGTSLLEGSLEYRFPIGSVTGALFVDAGRIGSGAEGFLAEAAGAITPGIGARFASPVGPIRIDLGVRPRTAPELAVLTELTDEEGRRELVRLARPRTFDPAEDAGFVSGLLHRLTLHFSIGEAF